MKSRKTYRPGDRETFELDGEEHTVEVVKSANGKAQFVCSCGARFEDRNPSVTAS